ncbi:MAG: Rieske 2Fe-2S domain-containing protein [Burkholderiales bacterium]|nr:Rieske 2Fe-2S domain-containing protein [Anaerolineae bacterium]
MATVSAARARSARAQTKEDSGVSVAIPSRREFLYYIWGASMALLLGETTAGIIWFALPRFGVGTFGGDFIYPSESVPAVPGSAPQNEPVGRFWMSNAEEGVVALYNVCTHLGCLPKWVPSNNRFECPCHGSKYQLDGRYIEGPAPRSLDRFRMDITFDNGETAQTNDNGDPIPLNGRAIQTIIVHTGDRIKRAGQV